MPRAQKGQRFGGRAKGVKNRAVVERELLAEQARQQAEAGREKGKPLAKDVLENLMGVFLGLASTFKEQIDKAPEHPNVDDRINKFERWALHTMNTAIALAKYQSPTMQAVAVVAPAPAGSGEKRIRFSLTVFEQGTAPPMQIEAKPARAET